MAVALQHEPSETAAEVIAALARAEMLPRTALRHAVEHADEIAPAVIDVVETAARGVFLMPQQENLLFWGVHAVAAAKRTELYRPILRLTHQSQPDDLERLLGDAVTETLKKVIISTFDGDPEPLLAACADKRVDGFARWNLMLALARLTFDGRIPRAMTLAFLDRFERESLADPRDAAWQGWQDAIILLGVEQMRDRLRATWRDGRNPPRQEDYARFERQLTVAQALAPGDSALFVAEQAIALDDPVKALEWTDPPRLRPDKADPGPRDPAGILALKDFEIRWLKEFLRGPKVPPDTMTMEEVDGFFCALIAGPIGSSLDGNVSAIWRQEDETDEAPSFDSAEQEQYVRALLTRHWTTIGLRLDETYPHVPLIARYREESAGQSWAGGFLRGMATRKPEWHLRLCEDDIGFFAAIVLSLRLGESDEKLKGVSQERRQEMIMALPNGLIALHHAWRGREDPFARSSVAAPDRKVGRNERCPCGSGKKYKHCCGSPVERPSN
jgi:yecA family protein